MKISNIIEVNDKNFNDIVFLSKKYVLVDFWADWCSPCKILSPILEEIANEYLEQVVICKINVDSNNIIPSKYSVRGIPTLLLFHYSKLIETKVGVVSKIDLINFLNHHLNKKNT